MSGCENGSHEDSSPARVNMLQPQADFHQRTHDSDG